MSLSQEIRGSSGPFALLLHGIPGSCATWSAVAEALRPTCRVLAPDLLGFGTSPPFRRDGHAAEQAEALLKMLDANEVERVHVVGFDFGGPTAIQLYRLAPRRIGSLTLAATNVFTDTPVPVPLRIARVPFFGELAFRIFFGRLGLSMMWLAATRDRAAFPYRDFAQTLASSMGVRSTRHVFLQSLRDLRHYYADVEATLPTISIPSAVVWGDADPFFSVDVGRRTATAIPRAKFELFHDCGHFIPGERGLDLAAVIKATISEGERRERSMA